ETVTVQGVIEKISVHRTFKKRMALTEAVIRDETGKIRAVWFNQPFLAKNLKEGFLVRLSGKVAKGPGGAYLQNPAYERAIHPVRSQTSGASADAQAHRTSNGIHTGGLIAVYPETRGITSRWLRYLISNFISLRNNLVDPIPSDILKRNNLPQLSDALYAIHFPKTREEARRAERRFIFEDLLLIQLRALRARSRLKEKRAPEIPLDVPLIKKFVESLPFVLTDAQRRSLWEIGNDLVKPSPMNRLLEGDVGSGKTVVAAAAALLAVSAGYRAVFMAPTEILARQHFTTLGKLLKPFSMSLGFRTGAEKRATDSDVVVGTHALIQKGISFENLGLVVVDEQHRFGVAQRALLIRGRGALVPHFLSMSATPIPRTLALSIYGDLDLSILDEMPKSRKPVATEIVEPGKREATYQFIREEVKKGRQVFVICPRIEISEESAAVRTQKAYQQKFLLAEVKSVKDEYK
ncbi:MAG: DEAD/DEAH box helicase, partial [Patescibacteria group bacterium]